MGPKNVLYLAANFYNSMCNALLQFSIIFVQAPQSSNQTKIWKKCYQVYLFMQKSNSVYLSEVSLHKPIHPIA